MPKAKVLFLCTGNSCRSQMAEGWLRHLAGDRFDAASAGIRPQGVNPHAVLVMGEVGIDISAQRSKPVREFLGQHFPYVITLCDEANEACPVFPGAFLRLHWGLEDPAAAPGTEEERLAVFRRVRDELGGRIKQFISEELHAQLITPAI